MKMKEVIKHALVGALGVGLASVALAQASEEPKSPERTAPGGFGFRGPPKEILEKYDLNKDGKLDDKEREALHKDVEEGKAPPPPFARGPRGPGWQGQGAGPGGPGFGPGLQDRGPRGRGGQGFGPPAQGRAPWGRGPRQEFRQPPPAKEILQKFDGDKDGKLDEKELTEFLKSHRPAVAGPGPMRPRLPNDGPLPPLPLGDGPPPPGEFPTPEP
jgi:hypothetical protein